MNVAELVAELEQGAKSISDISGVWTKDPEKAIPFPGKYSKAHEKADHAQGHEKTEGEIGIKPKH